MGEGNLHGKVRGFAIFHLFLWPPPLSPDADPKSAFPGRRGDVFEKEEGRGRNGPQEWSRLEIPVDRDGYVPVWAMIERFQAVGGFQRDRARTYKPVLPQRLTPEQII